MRPDPITITLSGKEYVIRPLSLGQLRKADAVMSDKSLSNIDRAMKIIQIGLERDHGDVAKDIDDQEINLLEISGTMMQILKVGGMVPQTAGESVVAPQSQLTGTGSTEN